MNRPLWMICLSALLFLNGCAALGYIAAVTPGPPMRARYEGLAGQKVAVLCWADRAATFDYGSLMSDVANGVQSKLKTQAEPAQKMDELKGTLFADPKQVYRWQKNHPELETRSILEIAPKLSAAVGATRVIYIELSPFSTRDAQTEVLLKGHTVATIRVAEINGSEVKMGFEEANVVVQFPEKAPEGVPATEKINDQYIYKGLVDAVSSEIALRFISYSEQ